MRVLAIFLVFPVLRFASATSESYLPNLVRLSTGLIQCREIRTYGNTSGIACQGIPLAKPPLGELRLALPKPAAAWEGVLSATQYRNACLSDPVRTYKRDDGGPVSEDCLYVNVFTSRKCLRGGGCAVLAVVHGGRYTMESPAVFPAETIVNNFPGQGRDVVVVTLPYRLGFLGFFNLPSIANIVPKNLAIHDLHLGLKWIQKEIASFGGDPRRVSLYGHSAGAHIVDAISTSPVFEGLFSSLVIQSGNAAVYSEFNENVNRAGTRKVSTFLGCANESTNWEEEAEALKVFNCVRRQPAEQILKHQMALNREVEDIAGIAIDHYFFPWRLEEAYKRRKPYPVLTGTVIGEMLLSKYAQNASGYPDMEELRRLCRDYAYGMGYHKTQEVTQACVEFYTPVNRTKRLDDDVAFFSSTVRLADALRNTTNDSVFVYSYSYAGAGAAYNSYQNSEEDSPLHSEDYIYVFGLHRGNFSPKDYEIERIYTGIIANFVNNHDPSFEHIKFPRYTEENQEYLNIDFNEEGKFNGNPRNGYYLKESEFWNRKVPELSGGRTALSGADLPAGFDLFSFLIVCEGAGAKYSNISKGTDKELVSLLKNFDLWEETFNRLEQRDMQANNSLTETSEGSSLVPTVLIVGGILFVAAVAYVALMKFLAYRKRRTYNEI